MSELTRNEERVLTVVYAMTNGTPGISVQKTDIFAECERLKILEMSDEEFQQYRRKVVRPTWATRN